MGKFTKDIMQAFSDGNRGMKKALPNVMKAFGEVGSEALKDGALDHKQKELIALAIGIHAQCEYCIAIHVKKCLDAGATREEIAEACGVAILMGGGPAMTYATEVFNALDEYGA